VRAALGHRLEAGEDWYTAIGAALRSGGVFVSVPDGVELERPIRIFQWIDGPGRLAAPRSVVTLGRGARATLSPMPPGPGGRRRSPHLGGIEVFLGDRRGWSTGRAGLGPQRLSLLEPAR
jgi:Fe-S cluster assembly protein SufD